MMSVDVIGDVRRAYFEQKLLIKEIVRTLYPAKARRPQGPTVAHEIAGPRIGALESRRDAAMEDAAEAAEAAAGHRAAHGWTSRVIPGPARRRQAALDTEARRLGREARTLEAGHGRAVPAVERAARREATATADAVKTWRWSPPVRHAQRDLATAAAIRATLAGQDPATITAAARGDLRAAGRAAEACAAQKASPGEAGAPGGPGRRRWYGADDGRRGRATTHACATRRGRSRRRWWQATLAPRRRWPRGTTGPPTRPPRRGGSGSRPRGRQRHPPLPPSRPPTPGRAARGGQRAIVLARVQAGPLRGGLRPAWTRAARDGSRSATGGTRSREEARRRAASRTREKVVARWLQPEARICGVVILVARISRCAPRYSKG